MKDTLLCSIQHGPYALMNYSKQLLPGCVQDLHSTRLHFFSPSTSAGMKCALSSNINPFIIDFASQLLVNYYWLLVYVQLLLEYYATTKGSEAWCSGLDLDGAGYLVWKRKKGCDSSSVFLPTLSSLQRYIFTFFITINWKILISNDMVILRIHVRRHDILWDLLNLFLTWKKHNQDCAV